MIRRVRRRARLVAAFQFDGTRHGAEQLAAFSSDVVETSAGPNLRTSRGPLAIQQGDWLVRELDGGTVALVTGEQFFRDFDHVGVASPAEPA